jgi:hypothetical protein
MVSEADVANTVLFLASDLSAGLTGTLRRRPRLNLRLESV